MPPALLLDLLSVAVAAEVTEMPAAMAVDVDLDWRGQWGFGALAEAGEPVGKFRTSRQELALTPEFSPIAGVAIRLSVPYTPSWSLAWSDTSRMTYDPDTGSGTLRGGAPDAPPALTGNGGSGIWIGAGLSPFNEAFSLGQQATWRIDAAVRLPTGRSVWEAVDGVRGAGNGGAAWRLSAAFSTERGPSTPWMLFTATGENAVTVGAADAQGGATELRVKPASNLELAAGIEIAGSENKEKHTASRFTLDAAFGYVSWSDVPSGMFLPSVLDASRGIVVTRGESLYARGGLGVVLDVHANVGIRLGGGARYGMPFRVESPYPVEQGPGSFDAYGYAGVEIRTKPHEPPQAPTRRKRAPEAAPAEAPAGAPAAPVVPPGVVTPAS